MTARTTHFVECDGDVCRSVRFPSSYRIVYGGTPAIAEHEALDRGWLMQAPADGPRRHLCPVDQPGAKCGVYPVREHEHIGPWEHVEPWQDVERCVACGHEISK